LDLKEGKGMPDFGEMVGVDVREMWPHEAADFTPWLADNIHRLGAALGLELELLSCEADVGDFSCDVHARDLGSNRKLVIENQLTATNHDHLGKLLTYAAGLEAGVVVWVAKELRDEHRQALTWLNARTEVGTDFYGVVVEVFRIDRSRRAVQFKVVVAPNTWRAERGRSSGPAPGPDEGTVGDQYRHFFQGLIDVLREQHRFTNARAGQPQNWYTFSTGVTGLRYGFNFPSGGRARTELYIDVGEQALNKAIFDFLIEGRAAITAEFGSELEWERLEDRRACRIGTTRPGSIDMPSEQLEEVRNWGVQNLLRFRQVFSGRRLRDALEAAKQRVAHEGAAA
jgi:hypothetical protein